MSEPKRPTTPKHGAGGYEKGEQTRARLLEVALAAFGRDGYAATTTRQLVEAAGVTLPALSYYFGSKQGLYLACAQEIVDRFRRAVGPATAAASAAMSGPLSHEDARVHLKAVLTALARLVTAKDVDLGANFVHRASANPDPAFEVLYTQLWRPGIQIVARLIARGVRREMDSAEATIRATTMVWNVTAFERGQSIIHRLLDQDAYTEQTLSILLTMVDEQIDGLER